MEGAMNERKIGVKEMAMIWGVSERKMYYMIESGECPWDTYHTLPKRKVAKESDVLKALEAVRIPAGKKTN
jgi:predicted DNA-binding transcriptional regulator AlpA